MGRSGRRYFTGGAGLVVVAVLLVAVQVGILPMAHRRLSSHGSPPAQDAHGFVIAQRAQPTGTSSCPKDQTPGDSVVPPAERGVVQSSSARTPGPLGADVLGPGITTTYYEIGAPSDRAHADRPVGVMLLIHGGGFVSVGPGTTKAMRSDADFWRGQGWETINVDYRGCRQSASDVTAFYQRVRQLAGPSAAICADGQSSGATLALVLAAQTGRLRCVISEAAITDITTLTGATDVPSGVNGVSPDALRGEIEGDFGVTTPDALSPINPMTYAATYTTPALLATAINDVAIPLSQADAFERAVVAAHPDAYVDVEDLPCPVIASITSCGATGLTLAYRLLTVPFVHGTTSVQGLTSFRAREQALAAYVLAGGT